MSVSSAGIMPFLMDKNTFPLLHSLINGGKKDHNSLLTKLGQPQDMDFDRRAN